MSVEDLSFDDCSRLLVRVCKAGDLTALRMLLVRGARTWPPPPRLPRSDLQNSLGRPQTSSGHTQTGLMYMQTGPWYLPGLRRAGYMKTSPVGVAFVRDSDAVLRLLCHHGALDPSMPRDFPGLAPRFRGGIECCQVHQGAYTRVRARHQRPGSGGETRFSIWPLQVRCKRPSWDCGIDANAVNNRGVTPLMYTLRLCGYYSGRRGPTTRSVVRFDNSRLDLIDSDKVNINVQTSEGTALLVAVQCAPWLVPRILRRPDVQASLGTTSGHTPLNEAISFRNPLETINLFLSRDSTLANLQDCHGRTPLIYAAKRGAASIMDALLAIVETDVNHADSGGRTALSYVAQGPQARTDSYRGQFPRGCPSFV